MNYRPRRSFPSRSPFLGLFAAQRVIVSRFHSAVAPMRASGCGTLCRLTQLRHVVTWTPRKSATSYAVHQSSPSGPVMIAELIAHARADMGC